MENAAKEKASAQRKALELALGPDLLCMLMVVHNWAFRA
ncbi:unnamed protein product [Ectocarpus sp. CCAP 1310/34]|nr:unnamed protein product [Ectocarpus sp. CCAP 1310/34]